MMCSIGVSAARALLGWIAVVQRPPPATAAPVAAVLLRNVRRLMAGSRRGASFSGIRGSSSSAVSQFRVVPSNVRLGPCQSR
jgi:hypothetical protein